MKIKLSAINQTWETNIPKYVENKTNRSYISYGSDNKWPQYLFDLYCDVTTLNTCLNGQTNYILGNGIQEDFEINNQGELFSELLKKCAFDYGLYGGFAVQIIRDLVGRLSEIYWVDFKNLRTNDDHSKFWYSKSWNRWNDEVVSYPAYKQDDDSPTSILYIKPQSSTTYPICPFNGSLISCEVEKAINSFHLNEIKNNFCGNSIINFNNGVPNEEQQSEIERLINQKFSGDENAARVMIAYNDSKDNAVTIEKLSEDNLDERYKSLAERSKTQIFNSFRVSPQLVGDTTAATGFNSQEYLEAFKVYNRTVIRPLQRDLLKPFEKIYNKQIQIKPFTLDDV